MCNDKNCYQALKFYTGFKYKPSMDELNKNENFKNYMGMLEKCGYIKLTRETYLDDVKEITNCNITAEGRDFIKEYELNHH